MNELLATPEATTDGRVDPLTQADLEPWLERHRSELTGYCYRMLGSIFEAEDAVQDTLVRAWRGFASFQGRSSVRSWVYRIATNVCLDMLSGTGRRARPMDFGSPGSADGPLRDMLPEATWVSPAPDGRVLPEAGDPAEVAVARESVRLAFVAALQHLAPRQRAVLILREVLAWRASEVAELLDTTVASVNSALQRARATLAARAATDEPAAELDDASRALLTRYVTAFESYDLDALTALLREDATLSMPPYDLWLVGQQEIRAWMCGKGIGCHGSRLVPVASVNGTPAFAQYRPGGPGGRFEAWAIQVIELGRDASGRPRITGLNSFLDVARLFPLFHLDLVLEA